MTLVYVIVGAFLGTLSGVIGGAYLVVGAVMGWLLARLNTQSSQLQVQNAQIERLERLLTQQRVPFVAAPQPLEFAARTTDIQPSVAEPASNLSLQLVDIASVEQPAAASPQPARFSTNPAPAIFTADDLPPNAPDRPVKAQDIDADWADAVAYAMGQETGPGPAPGPAPAAPAPLPKLSTAAAQASVTPPQARAVPPAGVRGNGASAQPVRPNALHASAESNDQSLLGQWLSRANWPVVMGGLMLFVGIGALLKYAADAGWFTFPPWMRLVAIGIAAVAALVFGFRQRHARPSFGVALQGVALGVLLIDIYAAMRLYELIDAPSALALMVLVVAIGIVLAVLQDAMVLAVLSAIGGFAAPVLTSTGSGNPVPLYAYLAVLNLGVLAVALQKRWTLLHRVGFVGTFLLSSAWGLRYYTPLWRATVEPFLLSFLLLYVLVAILAVRRGNEDGDGFDGPIVFGAPFVSALLLNAMWPEEQILAWHAVLGGLGYSLLWLVFRGKQRYQLLADSFGALGILFVTLAIPIAFDAQLTSALFAVEGALLVWLSSRNQKLWPQVAGIALQLAAGYWWLSSLGVEDSAAVLNGQLLGAILLAAAAWCSAWLFEHRLAQTEISVLGVLISAAWLFAGALLELERHQSGLAFANGVIAVVAGMMLLYALLSMWLQRSLLVTRAMQLVAPLLLLMVAMAHPEAPRLAGYVSTGLILLSAMVAVNWTTASMRWPGASLGALSFWLSGLLFSSLVVHAHAQLQWPEDSGWRYLVVALPTLIYAWLARKPHPVICWPFGAGAREWHAGLALIATSALILLLARSLFALGATEAVHIPLLNPLELTQIACLFVLYRLHRDASLIPEEASGVARNAIVAVASIFYSVAAVRAVAIWFQLPWQESVLSTSHAQSALSLAWSVLGVSLMIIGNRRHRRTLWLAGASLMTLVAGKLLIIDQGFLGTLAGISAFIGTGMLLAIVGYLAPLPPSESEQEAQS